MISYLMEPLVAFFAFGLLEINLINLSPLNYSVFKNKLINFGILNSIIIFILCVCVSFFFKKYTTLLLFIPFLALTRFFLKIQWLEMIQTKKAKKYASYFSIYSIGMFILTIILVGWMNLSWQGRIWAMLLTEVMLVYIFFKNYHFNFHFFNKEELKEIIKFGFPLFIGLGAAWILQESDKLIVLNYFDLTTVGIYTFAYLIGRSVQILNQAILKTIRSIYYQKISKNILTPKQHIINILLYLSSMLFIAFVFSILLIHFKDLLLPIKYQSGSKIIIIIFVSFAFFGVYQLASLIFEYHKKNIEKTLLFYLAALVNVVFSISLIQSFGTLAPAYGTMFGFIVLAVTTSLQSIKYIKSSTL